MFGCRIREGFGGKVWVKRAGGGNGHETIGKLEVVVPLVVRVKVKIYTILTCCFVKETCYCTKTRALHGSKKRQCSLGSLLLKKTRSNPYALRVLIYELFLKTFYKKMIKQLIFLIVFYISHESSVTIFLIWFINNCLKGTL